MKTRTCLDLPLLLALLVATGCDGHPTDTSSDSPSSEQLLELSVLADPSAVEAATELSEVSNDVAADGASEGRMLHASARAAFAEAREAWLAGDHERALSLSAAARRLVARSLVATGGLPAVDDLIERLEDLLTTLDVELFDDPDALRAELEEIIAGARALLAAGEPVEAAARALLGEQRARLRRGAHDRAFRIGAERARFEVALARTAVSLAERLLASDAVPLTDLVGSTDEALTTDLAATLTDRRNRWLAHARILLDRAEAALAHGAYARAVHFAWHAQWSALKAVILPGGIEAGEIRALLEVAKRLLQEAEAALGADPTDFELRVFNRATALLEIGVRKLEAGRVRGVAALWRSSIMSAWLVG